MYFARIGYSSSCDTFNNEILSGHENYSIKNIEVCLFDNN